MSDCPENEFGDKNYLDTGQKWAQFGEIIFGGVETTSTS